MISLHKIFFIFLTMLTLNNNAMRIIGTKGKVSKYEFQKILQAKCSTSSNNQKIKKKSITPITKFALISNCSSLIAESMMGSYLSILPAIAQGLAVTSILANTYTGNELSSLDRMFKYYVQHSDKADMLLRNIHITNTKIQELKIDSDLLEKFGEENKITALEKTRTDLEKELLQDAYKILQECPSSIDALNELIIIEQNKITNLNKSKLLEIANIFTNLHNLAIYLVLGTYCIDAFRPEYSVFLIWTIPSLINMIELINRDSESQSKNGTKQLIELLEIHKKYMSEKENSIFPQKKRE
jgi:hypothetical protein